MTKAIKVSLSDSEFSAIEGYVKQGIARTKADFVKTAIAFRIKDIENMQRM